MASFFVHGRQICLLHSPQHFLLTLRHLFQTVKERAVISALYVGTGDPESAVIRDLLSACKARGRALQVDVLLDCLRGTRKDKTTEASSVNRLLPVLWSGQTRARVALFHTPLLSGPLKRVLPARINEVLGTLHVKVFIADDTAVLTGANLSTSYLTDRQDRYVVIRDASVADYLHQIVSSVSACSYQLEDNGDLLLPSSVPDPSQRPDDFAAYLGERLQPYQAVSTTGGRHGLPHWRTEDIPPHCRRADLTGPKTAALQSSLARVSFRLQAGFISPPIMDELTLLEEVLANAAESGQRVVLASGYLNPPTQLREALQKFAATRAEKGREGEGGKSSSSATAALSLVTAAPEANSFHNSRGLSFWIPAAYASAGADLLASLPAGSVTMREYCRPGWTFHSKGIWLYPPDSDKTFPRSSDRLPWATVCGSSNFSQRSSFRDLELSCFIETGEEELRKDMGKEVEALMGGDGDSDSGGFSRGVGVREMRGRCPGWLRWLVAKSRVGTLL